MQLLLRHDGFHVDLRPSTSHVNSFHNCSGLPTSSPHAAAIAVPLKSQRRSCHRLLRTLLCFLPSQLIQNKSTSLCSGGPGPPLLAPLLLTGVPLTHCFSATLACWSLPTILHAAVCLGLRLLHDLPSAWAFLESCSLALKSARDKSYTWIFSFVIICF